LFSVGQPQILQPEFVEANETLTSCKVPCASPGVLKVLGIDKRAASPWAAKKTPSSGKKTTAFVDRHLGLYDCYVKGAEVLQLAWAKTKDGLKIKNNNEFTTSQGVGVISAADYAKAKVDGALTLLVPLTCSTAQPGSLIKFADEATFTSFLTILGSFFVPQLHIQQCLDSPVCFKGLWAQMETEFSTESLMFYEAVVAYQKQCGSYPDTTSEQNHLSNYQSAFKSALAIWTAYVHVGGSHPINIPAKTTAAVKAHFKTLTGAEEPAAYTLKKEDLVKFKIKEWEKLYDDALAEIVDMVSRDSFPRWHASLKLQ